jgi:ComF family protein
MIQRYKYGDALSLSHAFGQLISEKIDLIGNTNNVDLIIPMPMHPARLKQRGFNQALEIAKITDRVLNKNTKAKLDYKSVTRQTLTPPQASLPLKDRVKNIKGAFKVNANLSGKRIAIVDDVMTTGASLNELAKTLKQAGATHVECWVIARTLPH